MLVSDQVHECLRHAESCSRLAASQSDLKLRQDLLEAEALWLKLGHSYELTERLADLSKFRRTRCALTSRIILGICHLPHCGEIAARIRWGAVPEVTGDQAPPSS
jgi:hypothetical protein